MTTSAWLLRVPPLAVEPMISLFALVSTTARSSWYQHQPPLSLNWILVPTTASLPLGSVTVGAAHATWPPVPVVPATPVVPAVPVVPPRPATPVVPAVPVVPPRPATPVVPAVPVVPAEPL